MTVINRAGWLTINAFIILAITFASAAQQPQKLRAPSPGQRIFVWKDWASAKEASKLVEAGVNKTHPELVVGLMACMVNGGTGYVVSDGGVFASDVIIVDGSEAGCRGTVWNDYLEKP